MNILVALALVVGTIWWALGCTIAFLVWNDGEADRLTAIAGAVTAAIALAGPTALIWAVLP